ncbi:MAG: hypothetical protein WAK52_00135 [Trichococcus sp.]
MKKILKKNVNDAAESMPIDRQRWGQERTATTTKKGRNISPGLHICYTYQKATLALIPNPLG